MKRNKQLLLSSILCLLPLLASAFLYPDLPSQMPVHWNSLGQADGFLPKLGGAVGIPLFLLLIHLVVVFGSGKKLRGKEIAGPTEFLLSWAVPIGSLLLVPAALFKAAGYGFPISRMVVLLVGLLFMIVGNYLPKSRQNGVAGYKLPWTLKNADNWNKTHLFAGFIWIAAGLFLAVSSFAGWHSSAVILFVIAALTAPVLYSFLLSRSR